MSGNLVHNISSSKAGDLSALAVPSEYTAGDQVMLRQGGMLGQVVRKLGNGRYEVLLGQAKFHCECKPGDMIMVPQVNAQGEVIRNENPNSRLAQAEMAIVFDELGFRSDAMDRARRLLAGDAALIELSRQVYYKPEAAALVAAEKEKLPAVTAAAPLPSPAQEEPDKIEDYEPGDYVWSKSMLQAGEVAARLTSGRYLVHLQSGNFGLLDCEACNLKRIKAPAVPLQKQSAMQQLAPRRVERIVQEVDLHTEDRRDSPKPEHFQPLLDKALENALQTGTSELRIIHGKGLGVLKNHVHAWLAQIKRQLNYLKDYAIDPSNPGQTIVQFGAPEK